MIGAFQTFWQGLKSVFNIWEKHHESDSLVRFTQTTRVEPIVMVDASIRQLDYLPDVLQSLLSLFAAYYLQAAALQVNVGKINVGKFLNPLNPERPFLESLNPALASFREAPKPVRAALEATPVQRELSVLEEAGMRVAEKSKLPVDKNGNAKYEYKGAKDASRDISEAANLSIGRMYNVEISDDGAKATIPVLIRLLVSLVQPDLLTHILSDGARVANSSAKERWYAYKSGDLKFWRDLVFTQDLIDEHKKALLEDKDGVYANILARRRGNANATLARLAASRGSNFSPTIATASNLLILDASTLKTLEAELGGKFSNPAVRAKVFERTFLMIVVVINQAYDHVTFYHRGIAEPSELTVREIKSANKNKTQDISEIMKAYVMGQAPAF